MQPRKASTAVNVKMPAGRSCKGAAGGGCGCKGQACKKRKKKTHARTHVARTTHGCHRVLAYVTTNICPAYVPWSKTQLQKCCSLTWPWPLTSENFPTGTNRWLTTWNTEMHMSDQHAGHTNTWQTQSPESRPRKMQTQTHTHTCTNSLWGTGRLTLLWAKHCAVPKVTDLTRSDILLVVLESICYRQAIFSVEELLN